MAAGIFEDLLDRVLNGISPCVGGHYEEHVLNSRLVERVEHCVFPTWPVLRPPGIFVRIFGAIFSWSSRQNYFDKCRSIVLFRFDNCT